MHLISSLSSSVEPILVVGESRPVRLRVLAFGSSRLFTHQKQRAAEQGMHDGRCRCLNMSSFAFRST